MTAGTPVLVTGGTGFIGSHLVEALVACGARIRALVRESSDVSVLARHGAELIRGSLEDRRSLERAVEGVEVVFHLAALTYARSEAELARVNGAGTRALVDAVRAAGARPPRIVYLSSLAAVGPCVDGRPVRADDAPRPLTAYGRSKLEGERACLEAGDAVEVVILRAPAVYGPRDREMLRFFRYAARGVVPLPAGPERLVQLVHARDLARALVRVAQSPTAAGVYHVAEPRVYTWTEVVGHIGRAVGRRVRPVRVPAPAVHVAAALSEWGAALRGRATIFNRDKVRELLAPGWTCETGSLRRAFGFEAGIALPDGLNETAAWYREHGWL
ncbi:MAG TPA: NAD-dependent epimerase/dehydratase family protein [Longimicrobiales bacterium]